MFLYLWNKQTDKQTWELSLILMISQYYLLGACGDCLQHIPIVSIYYFAMYQSWNKKTLKLSTGASNSRKTTQIPMIWRSEWEDGKENVLFIPSPE